MFLSVARADNVPASQPGADSPEAAAIRQQMIRWNNDAAKMSLQELRKLFHTENEREANYADYLAHDGWEESKTQAAVRQKWGPAVEAQFAHIYGTDTLEDDQQCEIKIDGDRAVITWKVKEISTTPLIKINQTWLIDMHTSLQQAIKEDAEADKYRRSTIKLMKQATADIAADKFDDGDGFIKDFQVKFNAPPEGN